MAPTITAERQRTLLAALLLRAGQVVPVEALAETVWDGLPPEGAVGTVRAYVMRLRKRLGPEAGSRIVTHPPGYVLRLEPDELDVARFERLSAAALGAARARDWARARDTAGAALRLWRDTPLIDVESQSLKDAWLPRLTRLRLRTLECRIGADLCLGEDESLVPELRELVREHPLSEALHASLMTALERCGRSAEALEAFDHARTVLARELGTEPGAELTALRREILAGRAPAPESAPRPTRPDALRGPRQLPADTRAFVGREGELEQLEELAGAALAGSGPGTAVISAIDGMGGVGKSALALRAAHRLRERFPDGQLYLDLRGHTPGAEPVTDAEALGALLHSLGVGPQRIPEGVDERANLYRDRLADSRTLIVLDDAASTEQVRRLLPGASGCVVLVTSRNRLSGLDDAHAVSLGALTAEQSERLLAAVAGADRVPARDPYVAELLDWCAGLPLAVRIVGARLRHNPSLRVEGLLDELADESRRLRSFADGERDLSAVLSTSYLALPTAEQRLLRLMSVAPANDFDEHAAARLLDVDQPTARRCLRSLARRNLLIERAAGRYRFHDLVRLFARDVAEREAETGCEREQQQAALERLLDFYECAAGAADEVINTLRHPALDRLFEPSRAGSARPPAFADQPAALAWFRTEHANLVAAIHWANAGGGGDPDRAYALSADLATFLIHAGYWHQAVELASAAADRAEGEGEGGRRWQAIALENLGEVSQRSGRYDAALASYERALELYRELGDVLGECTAALRLANASYMRYDFARGEELDRFAVTTLNALGKPRPEAVGLWHLGRYRFARTDPDQAAAYQERAIDIARGTGDLRLEADVLCDLSRVHHLREHFDKAIEVLDRALEIFQRLEMVKGQANARWHLGRIQHESGDREAALATLQLALDAYRELGDRNGVAWAYLDMGRVHHTLKQYELAIDRIGQSRAAFHSMSLLNGAANAALSLARAHSALDQTDQAAALFEECMNYFRSVDDFQSQASTLCGMADLEGRRLGPQRAIELAREALGIARRIESPINESGALAVIERWSGAAATLAG